MDHTGTEQSDLQNAGLVRAGFGGEWWWRALALFLIVIGARFWLIKRYTTAMPYWDQWDGIGALILKPWLEGHLEFRTLFVPHNEHRIVLSRLLALAVFAADGQWDNLLECTVNTVFAGLSAVCLAGVMTSFLGRERQRLVFLAVAVYFVLPFGWENTLSGFQSQNYFVNLFSILAIWGLSFRAAGSGGWWIGLAALILACLSMATGFFAAVVAGGTLFVKILCDRRRPGIGEVVTLLVCVAATAVGWLTRVEVPAHAILRVEGVFAFVMAMLRFTAWPAYQYPLCGLLAVAPVAILAARALWRLVNGRPAAIQDRSHVAGWLLAVGGWVLLQTAATAYGRGGHSVPPACRYMDLLALGPLVNFFAWIVLADDARGSRRRSGTLACAVVWTVLLAGGLWAETAQDFHFWLPWYRHKVQMGEQNLREYIVTGDFTRSLAGKPPEELPYPDPARLAALLDDTLRPVLPEDVRLPLTPKSVVFDGAGFHPGDAARIGGQLLQIPCWNSETGSDGSAQGKMRATFVAETALPYLRFSFAGDLGEEGLRFSLHDTASGRQFDWHPARHIGERWHTDYLSKPGREFTVEAVDESPTHWFAFSAPVEVGFWSYWAGFAFEAWHFDRGRGGHPGLPGRNCRGRPAFTSSGLTSGTRKRRLAACAFCRYVAARQGPAAFGRPAGIFFHGCGPRRRCVGVFPFMVFTISNFPTTPNSPSAPPVSPSRRPSSSRPSRSCSRAAT